MSLLTIRRAGPEDEQTLHALAIIDSAFPLSGDVLVAQLDGAVIAAISLDDRRVIADPFRPTADTVEILRLRAKQEQQARPVLARTHAPAVTGSRPVAAGARYAT
jgi:hypothetical protein